MATAIAQQANGIIHGKHSPSSLDYKTECPGWMFSGFSGPMAERGTLVHDTIAL